MNNVARICQACTACCEGWVRMNIDGVLVSPGNPCSRLSKTGCAEYLQRPIDPCVKFQCGWVISNSPLPEWFKPNLSKVIVLFEKLTWRGIPVDLAVSVGRKIPPRSLIWLQRFCRRRNRLLLYTEQVIEDGCWSDQQKVFGYGPKVFQQEIAYQKAAGVTLW